MHLDPWPSSPRLVRALPVRWSRLLLHNSEPHSFQVTIGAGQKRKDAGTIKRCCRPRHATTPLWRGRSDDDDDDDDDAEAFSRQNTPEAHSLWRRQRNDKAAATAARRDTTASDSFVFVKAPPRAENDEPQDEGERATPPRDVPNAKDAPSADGVRAALSARSLWPGRSVERRAVDREGDAVRKARAEKVAGHAQRAAEPGACFAECVLCLRVSSRNSCLLPLASHLLPLISLLHSQFSILTSYL